MTQGAAHWLCHEGISAARLRVVYKGRSAREQRNHPIECYWRAVPAGGILYETTLVPISAIPSRLMLELTGASSGDMRLSDHAARSMI